MRLPLQTSEASLQSILQQPIGSASFVSTISLSTLFFLSRNVRNESGFHRSLAAIFVLHCIVLGSALIRQQYVLGGLGSAFGKVSVIAAASCFVWAFMGIMNLAQGNGDRLCFIEM
jgi:hypothetical protein